MKLSVVLPVRNGVPYIRESIQSILDQTWQDFELIVVNNGSTDGTAAIVDSFSDSRLRLVHESRRYCVSTAFNAGLRVARGRYIARMDGDDVARRDRFERQIRYLDANGDVGIVGGQAIRFDAKGMIGRSHVPEAPQAVRTSNRRAPRYVNATFVFRREVLHDLCGYREFSPAEDYDLVLRALERGVRIGNLHNVVLRQRIRGNSLSHGSLYRSMIFTVAVKRMSRLRKEGLYADEQAVLRWLQAAVIREDAWFKMLETITDQLKRRRNSQLLNGAGAANVQMTATGIAALSALHPVMLQNVWWFYRALAIERRHRKLGEGHS